MFGFKAAVIGAGTTGADIAQVVAAAGIPVVLEDPDPDALARALVHVRELTEGGLAALVERGRLEAAAVEERVEETLEHVTPVSGYDALGDVDLAIETVPDGLEHKLGVLADLDAATPGQAILAVTTSLLNVGQVSAATTRPDKVVGLHFAQPVPLMRLVEVVEGDETSEDTMQAAVNFAARIGKVPVRCLDAPGFVVSRILAAGLSEAWLARDLEPAEIDAVLVESGVAPVGPYALAESLGADIVAAMARHLRDELGERFIVPSALPRGAAREHSDDA